MIEAAGRGGSVQLGFPIFVTTMGVRFETAHLLGGPYDRRERRVPMGVNEIRLDADNGARSVWYRRIALDSGLPAAFGFLPDEWTPEQAVAVMQDRKIIEKA